MVKASVQPHKDLEAGGGKGAGGAPGKHYVPVLELFRGHWVGILVQTCYEACEYRCLVHSTVCVCVCVCPAERCRGGAGEIGTEADVC